MLKKDLVKLAEDLNESCMSLRSLLEEVFETSLNTSLAVGKIRTGDVEIEAFKVIAAHVESISKKLKVGIIDLIDGNHKISDLVLKEQTGESFRSALDSFFKTLELLEKLNQQVWLTMNQFRVQLSQSTDTKGLTTISTNIDQLSTRLEGLLSSVHGKAVQLNEFTSVRQPMRSN